MLELAWKSTLVLAVAGVAAVALRRSSAGVRHLVWLAALAGVLVLPLAILMAPGWEADAVAELIPAAAPAVTVVEVLARAPAQISWVQLAWYVWPAGMLLLLTRTVIGHVRAAGWARRARPVDGVRISAEVSVPLVCGLRRPVILLPEEAREWPGERVRVIVAHESMHVARRDTLSQALAQIACAVYWPHPLVWWAAACMKKECEQACDDGVLALGEKASAYAEHLVEILRGLAAPNSKLEGGIAMIRGSELERRLAALLNPNRKRHPAGRRAALATLAAAVVAMVPLAALRAPAQVAPGTIAGIVRDPSGARVPGAKVTVAQMGGERTETVTTSPTGDFAFAPLPDGSYELSVRVPGFRLYKQTVQVNSSPGAVAQAIAMPRLAITLTIGQINESVKILASRSTAPQRIRIGGNVQAAKLLRQAKPVYPEDCKAEGVEGTVRFTAVVSTTGGLLNIQPNGPQPDARLVQAAMTAVQQWLYEPTLLNGVAVEVPTEIEMRFGLEE